MTEFIEPLNFETILVNILSGNLEVFTALAFFVITGLCAFFRMTYLTTFFILGVFILMFSEYIHTGIYAVMGIMGGLLLAYVIGKLFGQ